MPNNTDDFTVKVLTWIVKVQAQSDSALRGSALELLKILKKTSPIKTGAFRGNWKVGLGSPDLSYNLEDVAKRPQGSEASTKELAVAKEKILTARFGDTIYLNDSVPYVHKIEVLKVSKTKAPKGVAVESFRILMEKLDSVITKSIKNKL
jgi:hypothetical protein